MRRLLDWIYRVSGALSVVLLILIGLLTVAQMVGRLAGSNVPSADDFATFCMAGSLFLGLAYTFRRGGHVRVLTLHQRLPARIGRWMDAVCLAVAAVILAWLTWYTQDMIGTSYGMNEHTLGEIPVAKWIPMSSMLVGLTVMLVAVVDDLVVLVAKGQPSFAAAGAEANNGMPSPGAD